AKAEHEPSALAIKKVKEMSGWTGQTPDGIGRGIGFSYTFGTAVAMVVEVAQKGRAIGIKKVWIACDVGTALDPSIIEAQMISGAIYGMSAAIQGEINFEEGAAQEQNFPDYDALRMHNTPLFEVAILENAPHLGGVGEPGTPPSMPALGNALFDLTGIRARDLPFIKTYDLVL
ncbi:MAG: molybdopterin-dependent oxidoreductase, partial [Loktanella sp.]|nr:molybdopterin-dependent oxidoreductase [Loktanella sp.]